MDVVKKVQEFIEKQHMIVKGDKLIVGVSGGADSVCLFLVLLALKDEENFSFSVVHVNHSLRGEEADKDEAFVRELCERFGIPLDVFHIDLNAMAKERKLSIEEAGREARRESFEKAMRKRKATKIALAHHQNDNAETLLWNLARGTGLQGMGGIRPMNGEWIHPLLCLTREEIEQFLREKDEPYRVDASNLETTYTRNKIRHQILPVMEEEINSQAVPHMNEAMAQMREVYAYVKEQVYLAYESCVVSQVNGLLIRTRPFTGYPQFLRRELIRSCLRELTNTDKDFGQVHVEAVMELFGKQAGKRRDLPYSIQAVRDPEGVRLIQASREEKNKMEAVALSVPGTTIIPSLRIKITCTVFDRKELPPDEPIPQKQYTKWFDYDIIKTNLQIRTRREGDLIGINKNGDHQKLKNWFINEKISAADRDKILLIAEEGQILWIVGYRMSSAYQISGSTSRILQIEVGANQE